ncbi:hypothetical protein [Listeria booriae]|uniref:Uncharacterized protein n=1 Tax=Listeria booriae TaxID=1552123 RepID=A0A7X0TKE6_9LIST|nr:hypothetical protein [Listeria booriae]MBC1330790.1 hypothetical protein [Listeria booriae]MBC1357193.1 hypothetical protein [Listeria booriae]MBC1811064.1 hypothetical protein [Listeria booriae]MBC2169000.1 hypothetical protein [Listeria booriae]MBC2372531.1 hypothetical protein [Listeria booriae]
MKKMKAVLILAMALIMAFSLVPSQAHATYDYPKKGIVKSEYADNVGIEDVYLNRAEAEKLAKKLEKGSTKREDTVAFFASLLPGAGPYLGYTYMASGWQQKDDAKKIRKILKTKSNKGIHIYDTHAIGRAAATGGSSKEHSISVWNGKRSTIKSGWKTWASTKKYLHVTKSKIWN